MKDLINNEKRLTGLDGEVSDSEADALMRELQEEWDLQTQRINAILRRPEAQPLKLNPRYARSQRSIDMRVWLVLTLFCLVVTLGAAVLIGHSDLLVRTAGLVLTVVGAAVSFYSFHRYRMLRSVITRWVTASRNDLRLTIPQVSTVSAAAAVALLFVMTLPLGDGHSMTQSDRSLRAEAYSNAETILLQS